MLAANDSSFSWKMKTLCKILELLPEAESRGGKTIMKTIKNTINCMTLRDFEWDHGTSFYLGYSGSVFLIDCYMKQTWELLSLFFFC